MAGKGPGAPEVGRVSIRVLPDVSDFRRDTEKGIGSQGAVRLPVDVDAKSVEKDLESATNTGSRAIRIPAILDKKKFIAGLNKIVPDVKAINLSVTSDNYATELAREFAVVSKVVAATGRNIATLPVGTVTEGIQKLRGAAEGSFDAVKSGVDKATVGVKQLGKVSASVARPVKLVGQSLKWATGGYIVDEKAIAGVKKLKDVLGEMHDSMARISPVSVAASGKSSDMSFNTEDAQKGLKNLKKGIAAAKSGLAQLPAEATRFGKSFKQAGTEAAASVGSMSRSLKYSRKDVSKLAQGLIDSFDTDPVEHFRDVYRKALDMNMSSGTLKVIYSDMEKLWSMTTKLQHISDGNFFSTDKALAGIRKMSDEYKLLMSSYDKGVQVPESEGGLSSDVDSQIKSITRLRKAASSTKAVLDKANDKFNKGTYYSRAEVKALSKDLKAAWKASDEFSRKGVKSTASDKGLTPGATKAALQQYKQINKAIRSLPKFNPISNPQNSVQSIQKIEDEIKRLRGMTKTGWNMPVKLGGDSDISSNIKDLTTFNSRTDKAKASFNKLKESFNKTPAGNTFRKVSKDLDGVKNRIKSVGSQAKSMSAFKSFGKVGSKAKSLGSSFSSLGKKAGSALGGMNSASKGLDKTGKSADNSNKRVKHVGRTFLGLTRMGWLVGAASSLAVPAIGLIAGAMAALPAVAGAAIAGVAVFALGFDGVKAAAQAAAPAFGELKASMSSIMQARLTPQFAQLGEVIRGTQGGMEQVAHGAADFTQGIVNAVSSSQGMANMNKLLGNTAGLFSGLQPFAEHFTSGLLTMAGAGSETFGQLAEGLNRFGESFDQNMQGLAEDGTLQEAIGAIYSVVGSFATNIGSILGAGLEVLPTLVAPALSMFDGLGQGIVGLMPVFGAFSALIFEVIGSLGENLGLIGETFGPTLISIFQTLTPILTTAIDLIGQTFANLGPTFAVLWASLQPLVGMLGGVFLSVLGVLNQVSVWAASNPDMFGAIVVGVTAAIGAFKLISTVIPILNNLKRVIDTARIATAIWNVVMAANPIILIISAVIGLIAALIWFFTQTETGKQMWSSFCDTISNAWNTVVNFVKDKVRDVVDAVTGIKDKVVEFFNNAKDWLKDSGKAIIQGFIDGIKSMIDLAKNAASEVVDAVRDFFPFSPAKEGPLSGHGYTTYSGQALVSDFAAGMLSEQGTAADAASKIAGSVSEAFQTLSVAGAAGTFEALNRSTVNVDVAESNAKKLADAAAEYEKSLAEWNEAKAAGQDAGEMPVYKEPELEVPDYSKIERSFNAFYVDSLKDYLNNRLSDLVWESGLAEQTTAAVNKGLSQLRGSFGDSPLLDSVERWVNDPLFASRVEDAFSEAKIGEIPLNFAVANLDQLKSDLSLGSGFVSKAIDAAVSFDSSKDDASDSGGATEVHYHVANADDAFRLEAQRQRRLAMRVG